MPHLNLPNHKNLPKSWFRCLVSILCCTFPIIISYGMVVLGIYNLKGGVGKTASTINLGYLAAAGGLKTLVWDLDPQGSSSYYLNVAPAIKNESKKIFTEERSLKEVIQQTKFANLSVIPADISARNTDFVLDELKQSRKKVKNLLHGLKGFDLVMLDCPPGISLLHDNIFNAANWVLMPNIPTTLSIRSYETVVNYFEENGLDTKKIKCFFSMVDNRKTMHYEVIQQFYNSEVFFKSYIPYLSDVEKMGIHRQPIFEFANSSYSAQCYRDLWDEIEETCL